MVSTKNIFLFVLATVALTASTILQDIFSIDVNVNALTDALNRYDDRFYSGISVFSSLKKLESSIKKGSSDANFDAETGLTMSSADSEEIISAMDFLTPDLWQCLDTAASRKPDFDKIGVSSAARTYLQNLQATVDVFIEALITLVSCDIEDEVISIKETIDGAFTKAIDAFRQESKLILEVEQDEQEGWKL